MRAIINLYNKLNHDQNLASNIFLGSIVVVAAVLRFLDLGAESYWFDEIVTVYVGKGNVDPLLVGPSYVTPKFGLYGILIHFWIRAFGTTEAATRSFSALCGIASIALIYILGRKLFGKKVALLSALLMAISEFQINYSQEARSYALFELTTLLSFIFLIEFLKKRRRLHFILYISATILLLYCHIYGVFVLAAQNLYLLLSWRRIRKIGVAWFLSQVLIFLPFLPSALPFMLNWAQKGGSGVSWIAAPPLWYPLRTLYLFVFPLRHERSWFSLSLNFGVGIAFFILASLIFIVLKRKKQCVASAKDFYPSTLALSSKKNEIFLLGFWLIWPIVIPFIVSIVLRPMYTDRYMISAAPALYLLLAFCIASLQKVVPKFIYIGTIAILILPGLYNYYIEDVKEQWREVGAYVEEKGRQGDVVVIAPDELGWQQKSFGWYYRGSLPRCGIGTECKDDEAIMKSLFACISNSKRLWLIMRGSSEVLEHFRASFIHEHRSMCLLEHQKFKGIFVYLFEIMK